MKQNPVSTREERPHVVSVFQHGEHPKQAESPHSANSRPNRMAACSSPDAVFSNKTPLLGCTHEDRLDLDSYDIMHPI